MSPLALISRCLNVSTGGLLRPLQNQRWPSCLLVGAFSYNLRRNKHSSRQRKRLFDNNQARARVEGRIQQRKPLAPIPEPQFPLIVENPKILPNGWSAPAPDHVQVPEYPFHIARTTQKPNGAVGFLPVYSYKQNTKQTTRIKKVTGDRELFLKELRAVLQLPVPNNPRDDVIRIRTGGTIEVKGNRVRDVKRWLAGLGF